MSDPDIRWRQRFANYQRALQRLRTAVQLAAERPLSELEQQGLIKGFEYTHELAWNVMKDFFAWQGTTDITGSRDAIRAAFAQGLLQDGEGWMEMIKSRNQTSHVYNQSTADEIARLVIDRYAPLFEQFAITMRAREPLVR